ncbi:MAG: hypothetical protein HRF51_12575 [bacterium]|jgi:hypothetical protein
MASKKQLRANRQNARRSTGPKTRKGKMNSRKNRLTHGLYSQNLIIDTKILKEDKTEYDLLLASLVAEFQPETQLQGFLVRKIANAIWRSRRAVNAETAVITRELNSARDEAEDSVSFRSNRDPDDPFWNYTPKTVARETAWRVGLRSIPDEDLARHILHYEMRLDKQVKFAIDLLRRLKAARRKSHFLNSIQTNPISPNSPSPNQVPPILALPAPSEIPPNSELLSPL